MKPFFTVCVAAALVATSSVTAAHAQEADGPEFTIGADLVSSYVWRGVYQSGASLQPGMEFGYRGFSIGAWGSTVFDLSGFKELDLSIGYTIAGFSIGATDYFWSGEDVSFFDRYLEGHLFEGTVGYDFGERLDFPLWVSWSTFLGGDLDKVGGKRKYSTYIEVGYEFGIGPVDMFASVGAAPWYSPAWLVAPGADPKFRNGFQVSAITLGASKSFKVAKNYSMGLFVNLIASPARDNAHLVVGLSF